MNCLLTGATGFIGGTLTKKLAEQGHQITAISHIKQPTFLHKNVNYINADITDYTNLKNISKNFDVVVHCAALVKDFGSKKLFYKINLEGTKNIVKLCKNVKCFIYIGHIRYESKNIYGHYTQSKYLAERYLLKKYKEEDFPVVIIRPGNVYGPGATTWVLRPLYAIQKNKILLIDNGTGIFHHTYITNLIDAILLAINEKKAIGKIFDITDNDQSINWKKYLNDLAIIAKKKPINKSISKKTAYFLGKLMISLYQITRIKPLITPTAVQIFTNQNKISIEKAEKILKYKPKIDYNSAMKQVKQWLEEENFI